MERATKIVPDAGLADNCPAHNPWRERLYARLRQKPYPLFVFGEQVLPAAAIWTGARAIVRAARAANVQPGDRVALALPPSPALVEAIVAGLFDGWTLAPIDPDGDRAEICRALDCRFVIAPGGDPNDGAIVVEGFSGPDPSVSVTPRETRFSPTPDVAFLLKTSGTIGAGKTIALSGRGILSVIESHRELLALREEETRVLSVLPWRHVFGLVFDLLTPILAGCEIVRDAWDGRNVDALIGLAQTSQTTHLNVVPLLTRRLAARPDGLALLKNLDGGVVGGACVDAELARTLSQTRLRVGYGQTEASPGITLGAPGEFPAENFLGRPVGCDVTVAETLLFRGANACVGFWNAETGLTRLDPERWHDTGDLACEEPDGSLFFLGRADDAFKLACGKRVEPAELEAKLRQAWGATQCLLFTDDGVSLTLLLADDSCELSMEDARSVVGARLNRIERVPADLFAVSRKGDLDRNATIAAWRALCDGRKRFVGPDISLTCEIVETVSEQTTPDIVLTDAARSLMDDSAARHARLASAGESIYGTTTGFGPFVTFDSGDCGGVSHGAGLIAHLGAGFGANVPQEIVRASMLIRAQNLSRGVSGIAPKTLDAYLDLLRENVTIDVPELGSVGASGDLVPLAHIAKSLAQRVPLTGREALALTNGTSFLTAWASLSVARGERLIGWAETLTGWAYRTLGCRAAALDPRLHAARGHVGQQTSAAAILAEAARFGDFEDQTRPLQEVYSLRCAPQILGACRENLDHARRLIEVEINGVSDNPLFFPDEESGDFVAHGGNFHGQQVAFAADALNAALTQVAVLAERQLAALTTPSRTNDGAPLLLAWNPGPDSGLAGVQLTATALVAEMRAHAQPHATFSIPTNGNNQDVVSMGALAARMAFYQTERLSGVLAALAMALRQLSHLRDADLAHGKSSPSPPGVPEMPPVSPDRALRNELATIARALANR